jgi:tetratricopeptide (TPR) repeat protein
MDAKTMIASQSNSDKNGQNTSKSQGIESSDQFRGSAAVPSGPMSQHYGNEISMSGSISGDGNIMGNGNRSTVIKHYGASISIFQSNNLIGLPDPKIQIFDRYFFTVFWTPMFLAFCLYAILSIELFGWANIPSSLKDLQNFIMIVSLIIITLMANILQFLTDFIITCFRGENWPEFYKEFWKLRQINSRNSLIEKINNYKKTKNRRLYGLLNLRLFRDYPSQDYFFKPTRLGNILASIDDYSMTRYGMDNAYWWSRLLPLLPNEVKNDIRDSLSTPMALLNFSSLMALLFPFILSYILWKILVGPKVNGLELIKMPLIVLILLYFSYYVAALLARDYSEKIRAAIDVYRFRILREMMIDPPKNPDDEAFLWIRLTPFIGAAAEGLIKQGLNFADKRNLNEAIKAYDKALQLDPESALALNNKGIALADLGKYDEAIRAYEEAIEVDSKYAEAWNNKGIALADLGKYDEAIDAYEEAIEVDSKYAEAWNNKGIALADLGKYDEAIRAYEMAISIDSKYAVPLNNIGNAFRKQGKYGKAIRAYENAIALAPNWVDPWNGKGNVHRDLKEYNESIDAYKQAIKIYPNSDTFNNLGELLKALGRNEEANEAFAKAKKSKYEV